MLSLCGSTCGYISPSDFDLAIQTLARTLVLLFDRAILYSEVDQFHMSMHVQDFQAKDINFAMVQHILLNFVWRILKCELTRGLTFAVKSCLIFFLKNWLACDFSRRCILFGKKFLPCHSKWTTLAWLSYFNM